MTNFGRQTPFAVDAQYAHEAVSTALDSPRQIKGLTTLRFFAALLVLIYHHGQSAFAWAPSWCQSVIKAGYVGVPFFFVLSGFILAYNYLPDARSGRLNKRQFWLSRFARIYPMYAVALVLGAPLLLSVWWDTLPSDDALGRFGLQTVLCFGLVQAWAPDLAFIWNGPAWSVSAEAFFYLAFPFLTKQLKGRWILLAACFCGVGVLLGIGHLLGFKVVTLCQQALGFTNPVLWIALFILGLCAGDLYLQRCAAAAGDKTHPIRTAVLTVALGALIVLAMTSDLQHRSRLLLCYTVTVPCAFLIYLLARADNPISRALEIRSLVVLGEASYSLYILHRPIHDWFHWLAMRGITPSTTSLAGFSLYLATCVVLSVMALRFIEYPCRQWIKSRFQRPKSRPEWEPIVPQICSITSRR